MALTWNGATERLLSRARPPEKRLVVVRGASRYEVEVLRAVREGVAVVVFVGIHQEPVDAMLQLRPHLDDDELAVVAKALGFGGVA